MSTTNVTSFPNFTFIVKEPGESKCKTITKTMVLSHVKDRNYVTVFEEFNGSLFCSSTDDDFEEILKLYNGPVSFDCIAIDSHDVNSLDFKWLADEMLEEFENRYDDDEFNGLYII